MAEEPNLGIIRELLTKAFGDDGISKLAFDEFHSVWNNFSVGMTRSQKILLIVDYVYKYGRIPQLLEYVKRHNPHQFEAYADRLAAFEQVPDRSEAEQLATYLDWVVDQYDSLYVLDMARARPLQDVYTAVELLDEPDAYRQLDIEALKSKPEDGKRLDGLQLAGQENRLFVQGAPGAGKTTFLKHLAVQAARNDPRLPFVPVFVPLNALANSDMSLMNYIVGEFAAGDMVNAASFVESLGRGGKLLLLLDALDEALEVNGRRQKIEEEIENFERQKRYLDCHMVITCRTSAGYGQFEKFTHVQVADFDATQMENFVAGWFAEDAVKRVAMLQELAKPENQRIKALTQTPLLLALLCIAYQDSAQAAFPQRRAKVYQDVFDVLLSKWDNKRRIERAVIYRELSATGKQALLAFIAYETFQVGELLIPRDRLETLIRDYLASLPAAPAPRHIPADDVLQALVAQHGIFSMRARDVFEFSHLAFQEYFAARYIVENSSRGTLPAMVQHMVDDGWREVFLLTASMLGNGKPLFDALQYELDGLIGTDVGLSHLLQWADRKQAHATSPATRPAALRAAYIFLTRVRSRFFILDRDLYSSRVRSRFFNFDRDLYNSRVLILDHDRYLDLVLDLDPDLYSALDRTRALARARDLVLARVLARDRARDLVRARALDHDLDLWLDVGLWSYWILAHDLEFEDKDIYAALTDIQQSLIKFSSKLGQARLTAALEQTKVLAVGSSAGQYAAFKQTIQTLMQTQRQIGLEWELSPKQWRRLMAYLDGARLLVACLDVANVDDRAAIEDRILRPPAV